MVINFCVIAVQKEGLPQNKVWVQIRLEIKSTIENLQGFKKNET